MDTDELQSDLLDALDEEGPENVASAVMDALLSALSDHLGHEEAVALVKKALAASAKSAGGEVEDDEELEDE
jgi:hypothetical protein